MKNKVSNPAIGVCNIFIDKLDANRKLIRFVDNWEPRKKAVNMVDDNY